MVCAFKGKMASHIGKQGSTESLPLNDMKSGTN